MSSFKCSGDILKIDDGPDRYISNNKFSSVTQNELANEARESNIGQKSLKLLDDLSSTLPTCKLCC